MLTEDELALFDLDKIVSAKKYSSEAYGEKLVDVAYKVGLRENSKKAFVISLANVNVNIMGQIESLISYYLKLIESTNGFALGILVYNGPDKFNLPGDHLKRLLLAKLATYTEPAAITQLLGNFIFRVFDLQRTPSGVSAVQLFYDGKTDIYEACRLRKLPAAIETAPDLH